jgi:uncharacterized protein YlzI (FlbEa/FlbD family)
MKMIKVTVRGAVWWGKFQTWDKLNNNHWETWINIDLIESIRDERLDSITSTEILLTSGTVYYVLEDVDEIMVRIEEAEK